MKTLIALVTLLMLTGCAANYDVGSDMVSLAKVDKAAQSECMKTYAESTKVDCTGMTSQDCMMVKMQQQTAILVGMATGKSGSPCGDGTNLFDVMKTEVAQKNESLRSVTGSAVSLAKFGIGVWGATEVVDSIGKNAGTSSVVNTDGGDSSISNTRSNTEVNTDTDVSNTGEEGVATAASPSSTPIDGAPITGTPVVETPVKASEEPLTVSED